MRASMLEALGRSLLAQIASVGGAIALGIVVYGAMLRALKVPEAAQIARLIRRRF